MNQPIFSVGHSNKMASELVALLKKHEIETLIDVRSIPYSKHNPQFNRENFKVDVARGGMKYEYRGGNIGGLQRNKYWNECIRELVDRAERGEKIAVMCSEQTYKACHRHQTIEPAVVACGGKMVHIQWGGGLVDLTPVEPVEDKQLGLL